MGPESEGEDRGTTRRASPRPRARQNPCRKSPASTASQFQGAKQHSEARGAGPKLRTEEPSSGAGSQAGPSLSRHCREEATEVAGPAGRSRGAPVPRPGPRHRHFQVPRCHGGVLVFPSHARPRRLQPGVPSSPPPAQTRTRTHTRTRPAPTAGPHRRSPALRARPSARPPVRLSQRLCGQGWVTPGADRACAPGSEDTHKVQLQTAQTEFRNRNT